MKQMMSARQKLNREEEELDDRALLLLPDVVLYVLDGKGIADALNKQDPS